MPSQINCNFVKLFALAAVLTVALWPCGRTVLADMPMTGGGISVFHDQGVDAGDPISANCGVFHLEMRLFDLGGPLPLRFELEYRHDQYGPLTSGWEYNLRQILMRFNMGGTPPRSVIEIDLSGGRIPQFLYDSGAARWTLDAAAPVRYELTETTLYYYLLDPVQERVCVFERFGTYSQARLLYLLDRHGNRHTFSYVGDTSTLASVEDGLGRSLTFIYNANNYLDRVTDQTGRFVQFNYETGVQGCSGPQNTALRSVTDARGNVTTFQYDSRCRISVAQQPAGNIPYAQTNASTRLNNGWADRVVSQTDAYGHTTGYAYDAAVNRVTETRPDAATVVYEHSRNDGVPCRITDASGRPTEFGRTDNEQVSQMTDRLGDATLLTYHAPTGKLASCQDALGHTTSFTYTAQVQTFTNPANGETVDFTFYNLTRATYADGTWTDYTYDATGNLLAMERAGETSAFTYNGRGQVLTAANPRGGVATRAYNADGTLASCVDSDPGSGTTTYAYDAYKRLETITRPGPTRAADVTFSYDLNDRLLTATDALGGTVSYTYDGNGNLASHVDPLGQASTYAYDLMDRLASVTDAAGQVANLAYDSMGRVASSTDRNGLTTVYAHDPRGWVTATTDPAGKIWRVEYDDEGVPTSFTTPLGYITTVQTDRLGRAVAVTDPLGQAATSEYDAMGRFTRSTDRLGRATAYAYDAAGRLTGAAAPGGSAGYAYDGLGMLTHITDPAGREWNFDYSAMGRLTSRADPLGRAWTHAYDARGRLAQTTSPDGGGVAVTYDAAGRITRTACPEGPVLDYAYDAAGRLLTTDGLTLAYDARGGVTGSLDAGASFGAAYDAGRRLESATYDGQATVTYAYDNRGLLSRVEDDRSGARVDFAYDDDGRLTGLARSNGVDTVFTYDAAGRVTRIQDGTLGDQQYTLNAEGESTVLSCTLPLDPPPGVGQYSSFTYDDAHQINSFPNGYDARGRQIAAPGKTFAYDGADRLVQSGSAGETADFTYNGLGGLRTRTAGGRVTQYYHNHALGLAPIVAERESGHYRRFYVYTPAGTLLYSIEPDSWQVRFYHFDRLGTTQFLTDGAGAVTDAYLYEPYGEMLGHDGTSDQPFTYVGQFGVRHEPVGGLYDMRARAYDPAAARFLTRDPAVPVPGRPQSLNPYQYALQNPSRYIDPAGTEGWDPAARYVQTATRTWRRESGEKFQPQLGRDGVPAGATPSSPPAQYVRRVQTGLNTYVLVDVLTGQPIAPPAPAAGEPVRPLAQSLPPGTQSGGGALLLEGIAQQQRGQLTTGGAIETPVGGVGGALTGGPRGAGVAGIVELPAESSVAVYAAANPLGGNVGAGGSLQIGGVTIFGFGVATRDFVPGLALETPLGRIPIEPWNW